MIPSDAKLDHFLKASLAEDVGPRDLTASLIPAHHISKADAIFKEEAVLCGIDVVERIFRITDQDLRFLPVAKDGELIEPGRAVFFVEGRCRSILTAERTALNFLAHLSGIATTTRKYVDEVKGTNARILDTRKTIPLMRSLERYAVRTGGGTNHRFGLFDGVLIKDNHLAALSALGIDALIRNARGKFTRNISIGVEVKNIAELKLALPAPCDYILLDNFEVNDVRKAVEIRNDISKGKPLEVSGGITLSNIAEYAATGVERISIGALTHTIKSSDISLNLLG